MIDDLQRFLYSCLEQWKESDPWWWIQNWWDEQSPKPLIASLKFHTSPLLRKSFENLQKNVWARRWRSERVRRKGSDSVKSILGRIGGLYLRISKIVVINLISAVKVKMSFGFFLPLSVEIKIKKKQVISGKHGALNAFFRVMITRRLNVGWGLFIRCEKWRSGNRFNIKGLWDMTGNGKRFPKRFCLWKNFLVVFNPKMEPDWGKLFEKDWTGCVRQNECFFLRMFFLLLKTIK